MSADSIALITGASSGIGEAFAHELAARGWDLVIVARRAELLGRLAVELRQKHGVSVEVLVADLADPDELRRVENRLSDPTRAVDLLINNAGDGSSGPFRACPVDREEKTIRLNAVAPLRLCHAALSVMCERRRGGIVNVSSVAGLMPGFANSATYGATQAFIYSLSESLAIEARPHGVHVTALCPGYVRTDMTAHADGVPNCAWTPRSVVVRAALRAVNQGRPLVVPGTLYKLAGALIRLLPRQLVRLATQHAPG
jgi:short-subunit dehydrogenase